MRTEIEERRRVRSSQARTAASHLLERIAATHALASLALCDEQGLVVVATGNTEMAEVLAAYAPLLTRTLDAISRARLLDSVSEQLPGLQMDRVSVRPFTLEEDQLFVVAVGDLGAGKDVAVCRALTGCIRILSERQG